MTRKWRPSLWLVLGGALAGTLALSLAGIVTLRYLGPEIGFRHAAVLLAAIIGLLTAVLWLMLLRVLLRPVTALAAYAAANGAHLAARRSPRRSISARASCTTWVSASSTWRRR